MNAMAHQHLMTNYPEAACPLTSVLRMWEVDLRGGSKRIWQRASFHMRHSKFLSACCVVWLSRSVVDLFVPRGEPNRDSLRHVAGVYGGIWGPLFFVLHEAEVAQCLSLLLPAAAFLEQSGSPLTKAYLKGTADRLIRMAWFHRCCRIFQYISVCETIFKSYSHSTVFHAFKDTGFAFAVLLNILELCGLVGVMHGFYWMLAMIYTMFGSSAALFTAIGMECRQVSGYESLRALAIMHSTVLNGARVARVALQGHIIHTMSILMGLPLIATVEMILNPWDGDAFTFTTFISIIIIFVPLCLTGQALENASLGFGTRLYEGPWLEEDNATRGLRITMKECTKRKACFHVRAFGALNAHSCIEALRRWFSFVNVIINSLQPT